MFNQAVRRTLELDRILALPRRRVEDTPLDLAERLTSLLRTTQGTMSLRPTQALALYDIGTTGGGFLPVGVGEGKTLISLLTPYILDAKRPLLVLPAGLIRKTNLDAEKLRAHWRIPNHIRLHSYEMLGRVQSAGFLEEYQPDVLIFDEAHKIKNRRAAVTRRVARYLHDHPHVKVIVMSGTMMRRSLHDFGHLLRWSLKELAPVPNTENELDEWAAALDENVNELNRYEPGALVALSLPEDSDSDPVLAARRGFRARLVETPGVVATIGDGERVDCSIYINAIKYDVETATEKHFEKLRNEWQTPDGWELTQAVDLWRHSKELALGFHYVRVEKSRYAEWLGQAKKHCSNIIETTTAKTKRERTLNSESGGPVTRSDIEKIASGTTRRTRSVTQRTLGQDGLQSTGFPPRTMRFCSSNKEESAPSVDSLPVRDFTSITTIEQEESEGSSAGRAIELSASSLTMSTYYRAQFPTFLQTARPPRAWLNARREWAAFVRETLSRSRTLDSELQVANAVETGRLKDGGLLAQWQALRDTFKPTTVPVWHDFGALEVCKEWAKIPGVIWTEHAFFAECLAAYTGMKYYGARGLTDAGEFIDDADPKRSAIVSLDANREGRNLQRLWNRCLFTSCPEGADVFQQAIGRFHRPGQQEDEVVVDILLGCKEHANAFRRAMAAAQAIKDTTGAASKLLLADVTWPSDDELEGLRGARWQ